MKAPLELLEEQVKGGRNFDTPPLHLWNPPLSGDISIRITSQGSWYHEGGEITRKPLVNLFASILRREDDGEYYLVTPAEKWRIEVESHALMVTDIDALQGHGERVLEATLNTGRKIRVGDKNTLFLDPLAGGVAVLNLPHGLTALCTRSVWYRLVDLAVIENGHAILRSGNFELRIPAT